MKDRKEQYSSVATAAPAELHLRVALLHMEPSDDHASIHHLFSNMGSHEVLGRDATPLHGALTSAATTEIFDRSLLLRGLLAEQTQRAIQPKVVTPIGAHAHSYRTRIVTLGTHNCWC